MVVSTKFILIEAIILCIYINFNPLLVKSRLRLFEFMLNVDHHLLLQLSYNISDNFLYYGWRCLKF